VGGVVVKKTAFDVQGARCCNCAALSANVGGKFSIFYYSGPAVTYSSAPSYITNIFKHKAVRYFQYPVFFIHYPTTAARVIIYDLAV